MDADCNEMAVRMALNRSGLPLLGQGRRIASIMSENPVELDLPREFVKNALDSGKEVRYRPRSTLRMDC